MPSLARLLALLPVLLLAAGCSESDATSLRLRIEDGLSGRIDVSALALPDEPAPFEAQAEGVDWRDRARVSYSSGRFASVDALELADLEFEAELREQGLSFVRVRMPRGQRASWFRLLTTPDEERRERMARALSGDGSADRIGAVIKMVIETPAPVVSSSAGPSVRGLQAEAEKYQATIEVPVPALAAEGEDLVWTVIW